MSIYIIIVYCLVQLTEIRAAEPEKVLVGMRNVVSSPTGAETSGEGFVVSFLCKLFNHQHLHIKAAPLPRGYNTGRQESSTD